MRLSGLILIILAVAAAYFASAPWFAFRSMRDAARTNDVPALANLVDYDAVRGSLADELSGQPVAEAPAPNMFKDPIGALKHAFTPARPVPPQVEGFVTPQGLYSMSEGRAPNAPPAAGKPADPFPNIAFWSTDRCRIAVSDPAEHTRHTEFTFSRKGLFNWKLTRIVLPGHAKINK